MLKSFKIALLLALMLPVVTDVSAQSRPSKSSSFKSGFSSGKSSSASSSRNFGSFGSRSSAPAPRAPDAAPARSGGFGAFGGSAAPAPKQSDSALSQRLSQGDAKANAMRTYDERKAAEQARTAPPPVPAQPAPSYAGNGNAQPGYGGPQPGYGGSQAPIIINNNNGGGGFGSLVTGFLLGRAMSPSHAQASGYPGTVAGVPGTAVQAAPPGGSSFFMSVLRTFAWLAIIALVGWALYFGWKFLRRGSEPSRANYSFDRN